MIEFDESVGSQPVTATSSDSTGRWIDVSRQFLNAVTPRQRKQVAALLQRVHNGGGGIRDWVSAIAWRGGILPEEIPDEVIDVYLSDSEAVPLHDCESCGLAMPIRPSRLYGLEGEPERVYFTACPACGSRTGPHMYFTRRFQDDVVADLRRRPR
jgi:hypothetical protein